MTRAELVRQAKARFGRGGPDVDAAIDEALVDYDLADEKRRTSVPKVALYDYPGLAVVWLCRKVRVRLGR